MILPSRSVNTADYRGTTSIPLARPRRQCVLHLDDDLKGAARRKQLIKSVVSDCAMTVTILERSGGAPNRGAFICLRILLAVRSRRSAGKRRPRRSASHRALAREANDPANHSPGPTTGWSRRKQTRKCIYPQQGARGAIRAKLRLRRGRRLEPLSNGRVSLAASAQSPPSMREQTVGVGSRICVIASQLR